MSYIEDVVAREVLDSRGNPTVEVEVKMVPSAERSCHPVHPQVYTKQ